MEKLLYIWTLIFFIFEGTENFRPWVTKKILFLLKKHIMDRNASFYNRHDIGRHHSRHMRRTVDETPCRQVAAKSANTKTFIAFWDF